MNRCFKLNHALSSEFTIYSGCIILYIDSYHHKNLLPPKRSYSEYNTKLYPTLELWGWEYDVFFIAFTPRNSLNQNGSTYNYHMYGSNKYVVNLFVSDRSTWYHKTAFELIVFDRNT